MKHVLKNSSEVAHYWANQTQADGRIKNMFFEGPRIWSYGYHFEIARLVKVKGQTVVLFTTREYSNTTSRHKYDVRHAASHLELFAVPSFEDHNQNVDHYIKLIIEAQAKATRARAYAESYQTDLAGNIAAVYKYSELFKKELNAEHLKAVREWKKKADKGALFSPAELEKIKRTHAAELERRKNEKAARAAREAERRAKLIEDLDAWTNGADTRPPYSYDLPIRLRVNGSRIETSRGAEITVKTALVLWSKIKQNETVADMTLDLYRVQGFDGETLTVGCHKIPVTELNRIAGLLKV